MKKVFLSLFFSFLILSPLFSQVDKIKKKSDEHKKEQSGNNLSNTYDSEDLPAADACTQACAGFCFDFFFSSLASHAKYLRANKDIYPNLFSLQLDADVGMFPSNDLYLFHPSVEFNWSIIGLRGDRYRLFQQELNGLSIFDAYTFLMLLNLGLMDRSSLQFAIGAFIDTNLGDGIPLIGAKFTWYSKNMDNSFVIKYKQTIEGDSQYRSSSQTFIDGAIDYKKKFFKVWHLGVYGIMGFNYQNYYDQNIYLFHFGINSLFY